MTSWSNDTSRRETGSDSMERQTHKRIKKDKENGEDGAKTSCISKCYERCDYVNAMNMTMNEHRKLGKLTDVVLLVGGQEFPCHKVVLVSASDYFKGMFSSGMVESKTDRVTINGAEAAAMETLLDYLYTGKVTVTNGNVQTLLEVANLLLVFSLADVCLSFMFDFLEASNCLGIWQILDSLCLSESCQKAKNYVLEHFKVVSCYEEFLDLTVDKLCDLISDGALKVDQERTVYEAVMKWFHHDRLSRCKDLERALELVKVELIDFQYLVDRIERDVSASNWELAMRVMDKMIVGEMAQKRNSDVIAIVGGSPGPGPEGFGFGRYTADDTIYFFNTADQCWAPLTKTEEFNLDEDVVVFDNKIYVLCSQDLRVFDLEKQTWSVENIPDKIECYLENSYLKWAVLQGKLYILAADDDSDYLSEEDSNGRFLCYDLSSKTLACLESPAKDVSLSALVSFRKRIYIFGRTRNRYSTKAIMQYYDRECNRWIDTTDVPASVPRDDINAVVFDRFIYLFQNASRLYVYDAMDDEWLPSIPGKEEHWEYVNCRGTVCNCKLYIMGGQSEEDGTYTDQMYCYDPAEDRWETIGRLKQPLATPRCVTIRKPPWCQDF